VQAKRSSALLPKGPPASAEPICYHDRPSRGKLGLDEYQKIDGRMREIRRTNDLVYLSWASSVLAEAGIDAQVLDIHTSLIEGSINAIQRRLVVADDDADRARRALASAEAEIGNS
jgi:hypothetical protein